MSLTLFDMQGRVALVTGAARGMGRAMALGFAEAGADLLISDLDQDRLADTASQIMQQGRRVIAIAGDITDMTHIRTMFERIDQDFGHIDVLGNVAGPSTLAAPEDLAIDNLQMVLHGLVTTRFYCCQEAGRRMLAAGRGSIINICSIGGVTALGRGNIAYSMAMGAVAQMTRELSTEWSGRGVRVNAILPAQVLNEGLAERMRVEPSLEARFLRGIPIGRIGTPDDIKGLAVFLGSDASSWITGTLIPMDGGNLAKNAGGSHHGMPG